jgi:lysophospholipase L1-like esterase
VRGRLAAAAVALLVPGSAHADPGQVGYPNSIDATGDSITRAFNAGLIPFTDAPRNSWSTGGLRSWSHYRRILSANPRIFGRNHSDARSGARVADLERQAGLAVSQDTEYVTILIGANDACASSEAAMTPVDDFRARFEGAMARLSAGLPRSRLYVVSIPNVYRLWRLFRDDRAAVFIWRVTGFCRSLLARPTSTATADQARRRRVRARVVAYNEQLQAVCALYIHCRFDGNAVFNFPFGVEHVSKRDYFHPSRAGQRKLADVTWGAGFDFGDRTAPISIATTTPVGGGTSVSIVASDNVAVAGIEYRLGTGSYTRYAGPVVVPTGAALTYRAVDLNGNLEASHTVLG